LQDTPLVQKLVSRLRRRALGQVGACVQLLPRHTVQLKPE